MGWSPDDDEDRFEVFDMTEYLERRRDALIDDWREFRNMGAIRKEFTIFVIMTHAAIEDVTAKIITRYVISGRFAPYAHDYVSSNMSQNHREQLLSSCSILSDSTIGELSRFKWLRNQIAHEPHAFVDWKGDDVEDRINSAIDALRKLTDALYDKELIDEAVDGEGL